MNLKNKIIILFFIILTGVVIFLDLNRSQDEFDQVMENLIEKNKEYPEITEAIVLLWDAYNQDNVQVEFEDYKAIVYQEPLQSLNVEAASENVKEFKTMLVEDFAETDVNFGGKYTIIEIPLTAWPGNYVMIDRETGNSYTVPFEMLNIETKSDSFLIKINPKDYFNKSCLSFENETGCVSSVELDMRPYYYVWNGEYFNALGNLAPETRFWD